MTDDDLAPLATRPPTELDAWLRAHLSRQVVVAVLAPAGERAAAEAWAARLRPFGEMRVAVWVVAVGPRALTETLVGIAPLDPDAVVVWLAGAEAMGLAWARAALGAMEDGGWRERWLCLLAGPGAERALARQLGYEDGLALGMPVGEVVVVLAGAAVANEAYRRRGSSPPCYLD